MVYVVVALLDLQAIILIAAGVAGVLAIATVAIAATSLGNGTAKLRFNREGSSGEHSWPLFMYSTTGDMSVCPAIVRDHCPIASFAYSLPGPSSVAETRWAVIMLVVLGAVNIPVALLLFFAAWKLMR